MKISLSTFVFDRHTTAEWIPEPLLVNGLVSRVIVEMYHIVRGPVIAGRCCPRSRINSVIPHKRLCLKLAGPRKLFTIAANSDAYWYRNPWPESGNRCSCAFWSRSIFHIRMLFSVGSRRSLHPARAVSMRPWTRTAHSMNEWVVLITICNEDWHFELPETVIRSVVSLLWVHEFRKCDALAPSSRKINVRRAMRSRMSDALPSCLASDTRLTRGVEHACKKGLAVLSR
jgi:hypothetical protein